MHIIFKYFFKKKEQKLPITKLITFDEYSRWNLERIGQTILTT